MSLIATLIPPPPPPVLPLNTVPSTLKTIYVQVNIISRWITIIAVVCTLLIIYSTQTSDNVYNTTVIDQYAEQLSKKYNKSLTNFNDPEYNKYPTFGYNMSFVPLISIRVRSTSKEDADWLLKATVKEVQQTVDISKISIEDILQPVLPDQPLRLVLIEGEPGIGKSTLAKELVLRWVKQSDQLLKLYKIVMYIQLRLEAYHKAISNDDLFINSSSVRMTELISEVKERQGTDVLWILDGFDELPHYLRNSYQYSVFMKLIKGESLTELHEFSNSTVIITSRPIASRPLFNFLGLDSKRISLRGFDSNKTLEYAFKFFGDTGKVSEFYSYYNGNPMIENMLYNPLNCHIICTIFKKDFLANHNKQYPRTMTELYNKYVRILLKRHLIDANLIDIDYLMPEHLIQESHFKSSEIGIVWNDFYLLSKIAYYGVMKQQYIFGRELHNCTKLSMMDTIVSLSDESDPDESSSFIHTTLQEYFAAVYLINSPDVKSIFNYNKLIRNPNLEVVLTFYVGMLKMINREVGNETLAILKQYVSKSALYIQGRDDLFLELSTTLLRCLYEHDSLLYNMSSPLKNYMHKPIYLTNFDSYIIGYLVATHNITFNVILTNPSQCKALNKGLQSHSTVKGKLKLTVSHNKDTVSTMLEEIINIPSYIPIIAFNFDPVAQNHSIYNVKFLLNHIISKFGSLQKVLIAYTLFNNTSLEHPLQQLTQLNELGLRINCSHENDLEMLKNLTTPNKPLRKLTVDCNESYSNIITILSLIKNQSSLEELRIVSFIFYNIEDSTATVWCKRSNSLKISYDSDLDPTYEFNIVQSVMRKLNYQLATLFISSDIKIQLTSFTTIIEFKNHTIDLHIEKRLVNITIYSEPVKSKLRSFIDAYRRTLPLVDNLLNVNTYRRCHKIQLNGFMYAIMVSKEFGYQRRRRLRQSKAT